MTDLLRDPFVALDAGRPWAERGTWPCRWISLAHPPPTPLVAAYRVQFTLSAASTLRLHVSADERYELWCDGGRVGRGPERGDVAHWYYETYDLPLAAGTHCLVARVWSLGTLAPFAQMGVGHGFLLAAAAPWLALVGTGVAPWTGKVISGCACLPAGMTWGAGAKYLLDGPHYPWGVERGEGDGWQPVTAHHPGVNGALKNEWPAWHRLWPATLPPQLTPPVTGITVRHLDSATWAQTETTPVRPVPALAGELAAWQALLSSGRVLTVPPHTCRRAVLDFGTYQCAYAELVVSGGRGARLRVHWAEGLYEGTSGELSGGGAANARGKGHRGEIADKCFIGAGDQILPDGGTDRTFTPLWWSAGRYVEVAIETTDAPLTLAALRFEETRYPLAMEGATAASEPRWPAVAALALRTLQMCAHETYMDCPYYEQLQYLGDTRLQALTTYVLTRDDRLPRKALLMGFASILGDRGLTQSRYPSRVAQVIPPFALWWVAMLHDFALWRGDLDFVRSLMPGARQILDTFLALRRPSDGLMQAPNGWNFTDWVPAWTATTRDVRNWGVPPDGEYGISAVLNWHLVYTLTRAAELEVWLGEPELAARWQRHARSLAAGLDTAFWDAPRGLYADDLAHQHYSEHAQLLAVLSGVLPPAQAAALAESLGQAPGVERGTIYFTHYLFEGAGQTGQMQVLFDRLAEMWYPLADMGFAALPEEPEPCRSDCHAWGAHPLYHFYATILGLRPAVPGGAHLDIRPQLGPWTQAAGTLPHPLGDVRVEFTQQAGVVRGQITLPPGVRATLHLNGHTQELDPGQHTV